MTTCFCRAPFLGKSHICSVFLCLLEVPQGAGSVLPKQEPSAALREISLLGTDRIVSRTRISVPRPLPGTRPLRARSCRGLSRKGQALTVAEASAQPLFPCGLVFSSPPERTEHETPLPTQSPSPNFYRLLSRVPC